ncbi:MAG: DUF3267 domain-containing protein, partial [Peptococcaceae bacterium]|nr:DUF3267 domain-containing protein [Peptococcaceae bacterium]
FKDEEQLPKGNLPINAVKFVEPDNLKQMTIASSLFIIPALAVVAILIFISFLLHGLFAVNVTLIGVIAAFIFLLPHELLHAVCFGKKAEVELYISLKDLVMFVISTKPISKMRFIMLSLSPSLLFGLLPLIIWTILPHNEVYSDHLFTFALFSVLFGVGDYLNAFNAARQMPTGSMCQLSGLNSYWFIP